MLGAESSTKRAGTTGVQAMLGGQVYVDGVGLLMEQCSMVIGPLCGKHRISR